MSKKSLYVLSALISIVLVLSLSACGNKKTQNDSAEITTALNETVGSDSEGDIFGDCEEITLIEIPIEE